MKFLKIKILFTAAYLFVQAAYSQNTEHYFSAIASDSAFYLGNELKAGQYNQSFLKGLYRIVFSESVQATETSVEVSGSQGKIQTSISTHYAEFKLDEGGEYTLKIENRGKSVDKAVFRLYWIYNQVINEPAVDFQFTDVNGAHYSKEMLRGKVVIMNFWGLSCGPCMKEIPELNEVVKRYKHNPDVVFIAVSRDSNEALGKFRHKFKYNLASDPASLEMGQKLSTINAFVLPTHVIIDKNGNVVFRALGGINIQAQLVKHIEKNI